MADHRNNKTREQEKLRELSIKPRLNQISLFYPLLHSTLHYFTEEEMVKKRKSQSDGAALVDEDISSSANAKDVETEAPPTYILEVSKSGRAECKQCAIKIGDKELRVGIIFEGRWGLSTRWQHLECTVFHKSVQSPENLDGYLELSKVIFSFLHCRNI